MSSPCRAARSFPPDWTSIFDREGKTKTQRQQSGYLLRVFFSQNFFCNRRNCRVAPQTELYDVALSKDSKAGDVFTQSQVFYTLMETVLLMSAQLLKSLFSRAFLFKMMLQRRLFIKWLHIVELVKTLAVSDFIMICINYDGKKLICLYLEISQMHSCLPFLKLRMKIRKTPWISFWPIKLKDRLCFQFFTVRIHIFCCRYVPLVLIEGFV